MVIAQHPGQLVNLKLGGGEGVWMGGRVIFKSKESFLFVLFNNRAVSTSRQMIDITIHQAGIGLPTSHTKEERPF